MNGKSICPTSTEHFQPMKQAGISFCSATNAGGQLKKRYVASRVFQLDVPTVSNLRMPTKVSKCFQGSELTITPIVNSFLETSYSWQINGEEYFRQINLYSPTTEQRISGSFATTHNEDSIGKSNFQSRSLFTGSNRFQLDIPCKPEYNMSVSRTIRIKPVDVNNALDCSYAPWTVDNEQCNRRK